MPTIPSVAPGTSSSNQTALTSPSALPGGVKVYSSEPRCEKCLAPLGASAAPVCRNCGWYAAAGTFIEIDRTWEGHQEAPAGADAGKLPRWAWLMMASVLAVFVESAAVRLLTPDGSFVRSAWSGAQFLTGLVAFFGCQFAGFWIMMRDDSTATVLDAILKPFKVAGVLFRGLPKRFWIVNTGVCGLVAVLAAVCIIGSVPYHVLWSWTVDYRSSSHLEDALSRQGGGSEVVEQQEELKRTTINCLIIGYQLNEDGNLGSVLVAREHNGRLRYVGGIPPTGESAQLFELREQLLGATQNTPVMPMEFTANWVAAKYSCEISYVAEQDNGILTDVRWEGDVRELRKQR